jgi:hypothetical protein
MERDPKKAMWTSAVMIKGFEISNEKPTELSTSRDKSWYLEEW